MSSFEDDMKDAFEGAEFAPSDKLWEGIESAIAPKKKKGILFMWQTYGVAAGILLATTFGFLLNDDFFNSEDNSVSQQLTQESKEDELGSKNEGGAVSIDTLKTKITKPDNLDQNALTSTGGEKPEDSKGAKDLPEGNDLNNGLNTGNDTPLKLQAQRTDVTREKGDLQIKTESENLALNTAVAELNTDEAKNNIETLKSKAGDLKATELLLDSKLNSVLKPSTEAAVTEVPASKVSTTDEAPIKSTITAELSTTGETAMRIQSAINTGREKSLSGSLGNNVLNISSGLGEANSIQESNLRDPNTLNLFNNATVDNTEGEALGAISAGLGVSFDVGKRLSLNMSLRYSEFKFRNTSNAYTVEDGKSLPIYIPVGYNPENVFFVGAYNVENTIQSIFLQTGVGYKVATLGKFDFKLQAGIGLDYFLAYKVKGDLNFLETRKINPRDSDFLSQTNLSGISGLSVNYRLNPKFGLSVDFTYRKFLTAGDFVGTQPSSVIGFGLSVNYILGKKED